MARYIKANPKVAAFLHLENDRNRVSDGNFLLWQADMLAFGRLIDLPFILAQIGAIALAAHEAREEQDGTVVRELPVATDPRFVIEAVEETTEPEMETPEAGTENSENSTETTETSTENSENSTETTETSTENADTGTETGEDVEPENDADNEHSEHQQND